MDFDKHHSRPLIKQRPRLKTWFSVEFLSALIRILFHPQTHRFCFYKIHSIYPKNVSKPIDGVAVLQEKFQMGAAVCKITAPTAVQGMDMDLKSQNFALQSHLATVDSQIYC